MLAARRRQPMASQPRLEAVMAVTCHVSRYWALRSRVTGCHGDMAWRVTRSAPGTRAWWSWWGVSLCRGVSVSVAVDPGPGCARLPGWWRRPALPRAHSRVSARVPPAQVSRCPGHRGPVARDCCHLTRPVSGTSRNLKVRKG